MSRELGVDKSDSVVLELGDDRKVEAFRITSSHQDEREWGYMSGSKLFGLSRVMEGAVAVECTLSGFSEISDSATGINTRMAETVLVTGKSTMARA